MPSKRSYTPKTLKILFAASGNQCAFPECLNTVVVDGTEQSEAMVSAQIAHIFAASDSGPRGKPGLKKDERNAAANLILLCPTHHGIVDSQHETYPASMLQAWKSRHEEKFKRPISVESASIAIRLSAASAFVDGAIDGDVLHLKQARFFGEFDRLGFARNLSAKIIGGEYSGGGSLVRCRALSWCARILSMSEDKNEAQKLLATARKLPECEETQIANAFCQAAAGSVQSALSSLALLNSPSAKTAAFQIIFNRDGAAKSVTWLSNAGLGANDFDADGKLALLQRLIEIENWDDAISVASNLKEEDYAQAAILLQASASVYLASALPVEIRAAIISQPLFSPRKIPLSSNPVAIENRKLAIDFFGRSAAAAKQFNCVQAQQLALDFALWLRLSDPMTYQDARKELEASLRKGEGIRRLPIALDFGIKLEFQTVEAEINKQTALSGGHTVDTALARLALALTKQNAGEVAKYIETYRDELLKVLDRTAVTSLEIEMLARSGLTDKASQMLAALNNHGLDKKTYRSLTNIIAESQGADTVATRRAEFENSNSLHDLAQLADALEERGDWVSLADVAELLFQRTGNLQDAERVAVTLNNLELDKRLEMFLSSNESLVSTSRVLTKVKCWMLFRFGDVSGSSSLVSELRTEKDSANLRQLWFNIAVIAGDWDAIGAFVSEQWKNEQSRTAMELMFAAQVGFVVQSPLAKDILFEAANRGQTDAHILIGAYSLATKAGIENDSRVAEWFAKGIELSGPDGPVERATLKDLFDRKPEWDKREAETWRMLTEGTIATFMVARLLRRTLVDLFLRPALANLIEVDPRKRSIIAAFAGSREVASAAIQSTYGFDPTSLLTLSILGVLEDVIDAVPQIKLPHSTMGWLLQEKERADFHQPSRIRDAKKLRTLVSTGKLHIFDGDPSQDANLLSEVDDDLAALISGCLAKGEDGPAQKLVVRPFPVHKIGSLMEEPANLENYEQCLCSCLGVLKKIKSKGLLTKQDADDSLNYLSSVDKAWPDEGEIKDGAIVFLDDLSVSYLAHTNLLGRLKDASLKAFISKRPIEEADSLIGYEDFSAQVSSHLDGLRKIIAAGIKTGKVQLGKLNAGKSDEQDAISSHPSVTVLNLSDQCDALVIDDRFFNKFALNELGGKKTPILTSLELLESLRLAGHMSLEKVRQLKTRLRKANFIHVPIEVDELMQYISECEVRDGKLLETAELRIFRECLQRTKMSDYLKLPEEATWLNRTSMSIISAIRGQWHDGCEEVVAQARSSWLVELLDVRGWSSAHGFSDDNRMYDQVFGTHIFLMMIPPRKCSDEIKVKYWSWLEELLLKPLRANQPSLYSWLLEAAKNEIAGLVNEHSVVEGKE